MKIILQYTLTDIRKFDKKFSLLKFPQWPLPKPYKEFVRGNGQIIPCSDNTLTTFLGKTSISESFICRINKGIKISKELNVPVVTLKNKINHSYSDGGVLSKYEFIFETIERNLHYTYKILNKIINELLDIDIFIRNKEFKYSRYKFKTIFKGLKELLFISTAETKYSFEEHKKYMIKCTPQVFVTLSKMESFSFKSKKALTITIKDTFDSVIFGWWENFNDNPYKFWVLKNCGPYHNENLNALKTGILRIHSEKECINNVIQAILVGILKVVPESEESDFVQQFLNDKIRDIASRYKQIGNFDSTEQKIENFIKEAFDKFNPGEVTLLNERMKQLSFRPQIGKKIIQHIVNNASYIEKQIIMDNSQSISFGDNAHFHGNIYQNSNSEGVRDFDFKAIYENLDLIIKRIELENESYEKALAIEQLEVAKKSTVKQDSNGLISNLKNVGKWTLDFASKIGVNFISEILKNQVN